MPPKTFKCCICGDHISKRKSFLYDEKTGDRACRKHEEAKQKRKEFISKELKAKIEQYKKEQKKKHERRANMMGTPEFTQRQKEILIHCWKCLRQGLPQREFLMRELVAMEKVKEKTGKHANLFSMDGIIGIQEAMKHPNAPDTNILFLGCWEVPAWQFEHTCKNIRKRFIPGVQLFRYVQLCPDCAKKLGYKMEDLFPEVTLEQCLDMSILFEMMLLPQIKLQAKTEVELEKSDSLTDKIKNVNEV